MVQYYPGGKINPINLEIDGLNSILTLLGTETVLVNRSGNPNQKTTTQDIADLGGGAIAEADQPALYASGQHGYYTARQSTASMDDLGLFNGMVETDSGSTLRETADGVAFEQNTSASINTSCDIEGVRDTLRLDQLPLIIYKWHLTQITDIRFLSAIIDSASNRVDSDDLGAAGVGLQFSTSRGDTNFQFVINDDIGGQTLVDSGVVVDTLPHFIRIQATATPDITLTLFDRNFVSQGATTFSGAQLPPITETMRQYTGLETLVAAVKTMENFYGTIILGNS